MSRNFMQVGKFYLNKFMHRPEEYKNFLFQLVALRNLNTIVMIYVSVQNNFEVKK